MKKSVKIVAILTVLVMGVLTVLSLSLIHI